MRARELLILGAVVVLGTGLGTMALGTDSLAVELPPSAREPVAEPPPPPPPAAPVDATGDGDSTPVEAALGASGTEQDRVDTAGWTTGIVRGDVQVAVSVIDRIQSISVVVEELRGSVALDGTFRRPYQQIVPVRRGTGTPTFEVRDIPFSEYPYRVSLYVPGLNGGERTVVIDSKTPLHEDLVLAITPGSPFSVLLRDQDQNPYPRVDVRLVAEGNPAGRPPHSGTTDSFGSVVFDGVLAGDYRLVTARQGMPLTEPQIVTVQPGSRMYGPKVQGQCHVVTVQRGVALTFAVSGNAGYGIADAKIKLQASDRTKLTELEAFTDWNGRAEFPHLTPGTWLVHILKDNFQTSTRQITIKDGETPPIEQIRLVQLR